MFIGTRVILHLENLALNGVYPEEVKDTEEQFEVDCSPCAE